MNTLTEWLMHPITRGALAGLLSAFVTAFAVVKWFHAEMRAKIRNENSGEIERKMQAHEKETAIVKEDLMRRQAESEADRAGIRATIAALHEDVVEVKTDTKEHGQILAAVNAQLVGVNNNLRYIMDNMNGQKSKAKE